MFSKIKNSKIKALDRGLCFFSGDPNDYVTVCNFWDNLLLEKHSSPFSF